MEDRRREEDEEEKPGGALHGDVLEAVVSRVSPLDLLPASRVSRAWRSAVISSVRCSPRRPPPWLILHPHGLRHAAAPRAFDPLSGSWRSVSCLSCYPSHCHHGPHAPQVSSYLRSPCGGILLCVLSLSTLALAADPFGASWRELDAPRFSRTDPVVALLGHLVVVAGGASDLEEGVNAVEVLDVGAGSGWEPCEPMPEAFRWAEATSAAASGRRLYVLEKQAPFTASWFDAEAKRWGPARPVRVPDPSVRHAAIGFAGGRLLLAGAGGSGAGFGWRAERVGLWAVDEETLEVEEEVGRMPRAMVEGLAGEGGRGWWSSVGFLSEGRFVYVYNPSCLKEFVVCEVEDGGGCRWERVPRPPCCTEELAVHRVVFGCCEVGTDDLKLGRSRTP